MSKEKRKCDKTNDSGEPSSSKLKKRPAKVNTSWFKEFDCLAYAYFVTVFNQVGGSYNSMLFI